MISRTRFWIFIGLILLVYLAGMFVTLIEYDSAQFAVMAMRMVQENDFINLFKGPEEYLDKPHLHYWLAALSFKIFGIHDWAYRIPAILVTLLGGWSCYGLGNALYNRDAGKIAALIFLSAQTIVLSVIDVRTDAVLTGFTVFALWQLLLYLQQKTLGNIVLGALGAGLAFSTKGQIALVVIALPLLCYLAYTRKWKMLLDWRVLVALGVFALTITPMLYAYYQQFDLHPEKVIRGKANRSGFRFIFWEQSFERLSGEGVGRNSSDYFFFFHTFLWVFLPWTVIGISAFGSRIKRVFKSRFKMGQGVEVLTIGGISLIFLLISFAQFKLPHYLNITIPLFAVLSGAYLVYLKKSRRENLLKVFRNVQYGIFALCFVVAALLTQWVFESENILVGNFYLAFILVAVYFAVVRKPVLSRIISVGVLSSVLLNLVMNISFYPSLLKYEAGATIADVVSEKSIPADRIYKIAPHPSWALDFYNRKPVKITNLDKVEQMNDVWVYATDEDLDALKEKGLLWEEQYTADQFRITRLQARFLNPDTRREVLRKRHLIHLK
ncbi:ArnT family glycosyltransferase [Lentiprolixibacter aurantiacus]|uniref:Glycosyltransferase family 39 protein n=1 Tax=Lentiprolixibacter aurantiacus TaxID=2993939 RepID=A0AAE3SQE8_9FLAO|nr:glycosyltransferase family 39 protein [Lentiprolixibacter aurantiacus]MCX2720452.1 glycosyltransferase family 39 protein [Lentiprolixibacter aurantiacus]